jgi:Carboxypeptidase regulatory-like domain
MSRAINATLLLFLFAGMVVAQTVTCQLTGTVTDPSGAAVPDAELTAIHLATGVSTRAISNSLGYFTFPRL